MQSTTHGVERTLCRAVGLQKRQAAVGQRPVSVCTERADVNNADRCSFLVAMFDSRQALNRASPSFNPGMLRTDYSDFARNRARSSVSRRTVPRTEYPPRCSCRCFRARALARMQDNTAFPHPEKRNSCIRDGVRTVRARKQGV